MKSKSKSLQLRLIYMLEIGPYILLCSSNQTDAPIYPGNCKNGWIFCLEPINQMERNRMPFLCLNLSWNVWYVINRKVINWKLIHCFVVHINWFERKFHSFLCSTNTVRIAHHQQQGHILSYFCVSLSLCVYTFSGWYVFDGFTNNEFFNMIITEFCFPFTE